MLNYIFCVFLGLFSALAASDLVVGTTSGYAPFVSLDEQGRYVGFDIDMAQALSKKLNRTLVIKDLGSMPALFLALKQKKVDVLIWSISITKERQEKCKMIYYQGKKVTKLPLLFWKKIPKGLTSIEAIAASPDTIVCVEAGSFQEGFLRSVSGLSIKNVDKVVDAIMEIKYGKSTATMIDPTLLAGYKTQYPEIEVLDVPLPENQQALGNGLCIDKGNQDLIESVEKAIYEMQNDGTIKELEQKWNIYE